MEANWWIDKATGSVTNLLSASRGFPSALAPFGTARREKKTIRARMLMIQFGTRAY